MYLTYAEYQSMGGTLDEATFNNYEFEAESLVNWYTFDRLKADVSFPSEVLRCMYALINLIEKKENASTLGNSSNGGSAAIASQSNDGVSISYNVLSAQALVESTDKACEATVKRYLNGVMNSLGKKLLYRGVYPDE